MTLHDDEAAMKAEISKAESLLASDLAKATGMVKPHMVWVAGGIGLSRALSWGESCERGRYRHPTAQDQ